MKTQVKRIRVKRKPADTSIPIKWEHLIPYQFFISTGKSKATSLHRKLPDGNSLLLDCPNHWQADQKQLDCLLRHSPSGVANFCQYQTDRGLYFVVDSSDYITLAEVKREWDFPQTINFLLDVIAILGEITDHLLTVDLRLIKPDFIFVNKRSENAIQLISLPVPEGIDIFCAGIDPTNEQSLVDWLAVKGDWPEQHREKISEFFAHKAWQKTTNYLKALCREGQGPMENNNLDTTLPPKRYERVQDKDGGFFAGLASHTKNLRKQLLTKLGLAAGNQVEEFGLAAEPTEYLNQSNSGYRMATLSETLPGSTHKEGSLKAFILVDEFVIGRDAEQADFLLPIPTVGRRHARILRRGDSFFLEDLGSKNSTFLDGRRIDKFRETLLPDRCRLTFAGNSFFFTADRENKTGYD